MVKIQIGIDFRRRVEPGTVFILKWRDNRLYFFARRRLREDPCKLQPRRCAKERIRIFNQLAQIRDCLVAFAL